MKRAEHAFPNELLSYERERHHWTQEEVAQHIGAPDPNMIGRWERGITQPTAYYRQQLVTLFGKSDRELGFVRKGETPLWRVPQRQNVFFTGREALLTQVHASLFAQRRATLMPPQALSGLGGVGKTQTALEYAYRYRHEYHTIAWLRASSTEVLLSDFAALTTLFNLPEQREKDQSQMIRAVKNWLAALTRWLLIFDNADDLDLLSTLLPPSPHGHLLLTTRTRITGTIAHAIEIETMDPEEGAFFLLRRAKLLALDALPNETAELNHDQARAISTLLGGLPLALDQAGAYIEETGCSLSSYLKLYHTQRAELLHRRGELITDHPESVATTWSLSFDKISQINLVALELLTLCTFLAPDAIPEELLISETPETEPQFAPLAANPLQLDQAIKDLRHFSLLRRHPETNMLSMHRLVQAVLLDKMEAETQRQWAARVVRILNRAFPNGYFATWKQCERLLSQAFVGVELIERWDITTIDAAQLLLHLARYLNKRGQFSQVERLFLQAQALFVKILGAAHLEVAQCLFELGCYYVTTNKYAQAETIHQQALQMREHLLGPDHIDVAQSLHELGIMSFGLAKYAEAETFIQRALKIVQTVNSTHPNLPEIMNDLAAVYRKQKNYAMAEPLFHQALQQHEQYFGQLNPLTGGHLYNLASFYLDLGRYSEAEAYYLRALTSWERAVGVEDIDYAYGLRGLANLYAAQNNYSLAEPLYLQALTIFEATLGSESTNVARVLSSLAKLYTAQGNYSKAKPLYLQALTLLEATLGSAHPDVVETLNDLAQLHAAAGTST